MSGIPTVSKGSPMKTSRHPKVTPPKEMFGDEGATYNYKIIANKRNICSKMFYPLEDKKI